MEERNENVHISEDISKEIEDAPEHVVTPTKILSTSEEKNKRNMISNEGKRKRGRPSDKDKEGLPKSNPKHKFSQKLH